MAGLSLFFPSLKHISYITSFINFFAQSFNLDVYFYFFFLPFLFISFINS